MDRIEIPFDTFEDAMTIHKKLFTMLKEKKELFLEDLFPMMIIPEELKYHGWYSLMKSKVEQKPDGEWVIIMPEFNVYRKGE